MEALMYVNECKFDCTLSSADFKAFDRLVKKHNINLNVVKEPTLGGIVFRTEFDNAILHDIKMVEYFNNSVYYSKDELHDFRDFMVAMNVHFTVEVTVVGMAFDDQLLEDVIKPVRYLINNDGVFVKLLELSDKTNYTAF